MGVDPRSLALLRAAPRFGVDFSASITIGRQDLYGLGPVAPADHVFRDLGAERLDALDNSPYEGASVLHDLNQPLPKELKGRYTAVYDGGSLEHVFDVSTALRNCMDLVAPGGHYLAASPGNNQMGHGFYQFSPEFYFRAFSADSGFRVLGLWAVERRLVGSRWWAAQDPAASGCRMQVRTRYPVEILLIAQRLRTDVPTATVPQQSDYVAAWTDASSTTGRSRAARLAALLPGRALSVAEELAGRRHTTWRGAGFSRVQPGAAGPSKTLHATSARAAGPDSGRSS